MVGCFLLLFGFCLFFFFFVYPEIGFICPQKKEQRLSLQCEDWRVLQDWGREWGRQEKDREDIWGEDWFSNLKDKSGILQGIYKKYEPTYRELIIEKCKAITVRMNSPVKLIIQWGSYYSKNISDHERLGIQEKGACKQSIFRTWWTSWPWYESVSLVFLPFHYLQIISQGFVQPGEEKVPEKLYHGLFDF